MVEESAHHGKGVEKSGSFKLPEMKVSLYYKLNFVVVGAGPKITPFQDLR